MDGPRIMKKSKKSYDWPQYKSFHDFLHPDPEKTTLPDLTPEAANHFNKVIEVVGLWMRKNHKRVSPCLWHTAKVVIAARCVGMRMHETYRAHALWGSEYNYDTVMIACRNLNDSGAWTYNPTLGHIPGPTSTVIPIFRDTTSGERTWHVPMPESLEKVVLDWIEANEYDVESVYVMVNGKPRGVEPKQAWRYPKLDAMLASLKGSQ